MNAYLYHENKGISNIGKKVKVSWFSQMKMLLNERNIPLQRYFIMMKCAYNRSI
jgi:hypothetical protein